MKINSQTRIVLCQRHSWKSQLIYLKICFIFLVICFTLSWGLQYYTQLEVKYFIN
jgi:hypothetical protein